MAAAKGSRNPSTKNLGAMPDPAKLWERCVSLAIVEAVIGEEHRHYRLNPAWTKGALFTRDNGAGDRYAIAFVSTGIFVRGFDHNSPMSPYASVDNKTIWPGMYGAVSKSMQDLPNDASIEADPLAVTFCLVFSRAMARWATGVKTFAPGDDSDGSSWLLGALASGARGYVDWATLYYKRPIVPETISAIFAHEPLVDEALTKLNPTVDIATVRALAVAAHYGKDEFPPFA